MPFKKTIKLIHKYNTNPSAILPTKFSIRANTIRETNEIKFLPENEIKVEKSHLKEYNENSKKENHFFGCPHSVYVKYYHHDLSIFLEMYPDGTELDFIVTELQMGILKFEFPFISDYLDSVILMSLTRRHEFIEERVYSLGYKLEYTAKQNENSTRGFDEKFVIYKNEKFKKENLASSNLVWNLSKNDLIELISGLIETKAFGDVDDIEIIENIGRSFNKKIKGYKQAESQIRKRVKDLTIFLDFMKLKIEQRKIRLDEEKKPNKK